LLVFVTVAENCCDPPALSETVAGATVIDTGKVYVADDTGLLAIPVSKAIARMVSVAFTAIGLV
jgi:hypothetical protein